MPAPQIVPSISVANLVAKHQPLVTSAALTITTVKLPITTEQTSCPSPLSTQTVTPTTIPQVLKPVVEPPTPSPDQPKPNVLSPVTTYSDPLEQSLANLEHDMKRSDPVDPMMQIATTLSNSTVSQQNSIINITPNLTHPILQPSQMGMDLKAPIISTNIMPVNPLIQSQSVEPQNNQQTVMHAHNNGFGIKHDFEIGNNNGFAQVGLPIEMSISAMFDQLPPAINNQLMKNEHQLKLEDTIGTLNDKKPLDQKAISQTFGSFKTNKQESNVKNASSWSSLAKGKSPQNNTPGGTSKQQVMDSFKAFQNKAKEKADREKQRLENLEMKRQQREQAERERLRAENERRREREEEDALEKAR